MQTTANKKESVAASATKPGEGFFFQSKLTINQPNDVYEQEADAMADKVMRMPDPVVNNNFFFKPGISSIQRKCAHCDEEEKQLQRKEIKSEITDTKQNPTTNQHTDVYTQQADARVNKVTRMQDHSSLLTSNKAFFSPPTVNINKPITAKEEPLKKENKEEETKEAWSEIQAKLSFNGLPLPSDDNKANDKTFIQCKCSQCEEEEKLQRKEINNSGTTVDTPTENYISSLNGKGRSLDEEERSFFEPRMGYDFSNVQLHTGEEASQSAKSIKALAYTHGNNIVFGSTQYQPNTDNGKKLMAHELTHVVQQKAIGNLQKKENPDFGNNSENNLSARFIVEDNVIPTNNQMRRTAFFDLLQNEICQTVDNALQGTSYTSDNCPYIQAAFARYQNSPSAILENVLIRYQPLAGFANNAIDFIRQVNVRVLASVTRWRQTRDISDVPLELIAELPSNLRADANQAVSGAVSAVSGLFFKTKSEASPVRQSPIGVMQQLGKGNPIDNSTRNNMENAFGANFSNVQIHTDSIASRLTDNMNARAFTVGNHIAFSGGEHKPGTLEGDALIAHELAHVIQQKGSFNELQQKDEHYDETGLETDADNAAVTVITKVWRNSIGSLFSNIKDSRPNLKSRLKLQRCTGTNCPSGYSWGIVNRTCAAAIGDCIWACVPFSASGPSISDPNAPRPSMPSRKHTVGVCTGGLPDVYIGCLPLKDEDGNIIGSDNQIGANPNQDYTGALAGAGQMAQQRGAVPSQTTDQRPRAAVVEPLEPATPTTPPTAGRGTTTTPPETPGTTRGSTPAPPAKSPPGTTDGTPLDPTTPTRTTTPSAGRTRGREQPTEIKPGVTPRGVTPQTTPSAVISNPTTTNVDQLTTRGYESAGFSPRGTSFYYRNATTSDLVELQLRQGGPSWVSPLWGRSRLESEMRERGFRFTRGTRGEGGMIFRNSTSGEEFRIMPRPEQRFRNEPIEKHLNDNYFRYRTGSDQAWGDHTTISNR